MDYRFSGVGGYFGDGATPEARAKATRALADFATHMGNVAEHLRRGTAEATDAARASLAYAEREAGTLRLASDAADEALRDVKAALDARPGGGREDEAASPKPAKNAKH